MASISRTWTASEMEWEQANLIKIQAYDQDTKGIKVQDFNITLLDVEKHRIGHKGVNSPYSAKSTKMMQIHQL